MYYFKCAHTNRNKINWIHIKDFDIPRKENIIISGTKQNMCHINIQGIDMVREMVLVQVCVSTIIYNTGGLN